MKTELYHKWLELVREKSKVKPEWLKPLSFKDGDPYKALSASLKAQFYGYASLLWQSEVGAEFWFKHRQHSRKWPLQAIQETLHQESPEETQARWLKATKDKFYQYHTNHMCYNIVSSLQSIVLHADKPACN